MRTLFELRVEPDLPERLVGLRELADNLWWSWNPRAIDLFRRVDDELWETSGHNPVRMLAELRPEALAALAADHSFLEHLDRVHDELRAYLAAETWYATQCGPTDHPLIAYFSMEFGLTECLRLYSGGLGVLAGDHLKAASDQGLPLVGVTLLFQKGFFQQYLNPDGWQQESYPVNEFCTLPVSRVVDPEGRPVRVTLDFPGRPVHVQVWRCLVGRVTLYLLDTNLPDNRWEDQNITDQLYGGDSVLRMQQEIVLGIGGIRALAALGITPLVCHINEGHAAFSGLERIRLAMVDHGLTFRDARVATGGGNVFTTHTPVPAGFDLFPVELMREYFGVFVAKLGISLDDLLEIGRAEPTDPAEPFNMAILAMRFSTFTNGVSRLHGAVTRKMVAKKYADFPLDEIPVGHVTNGVHLRSWMSLELTELLDRYLGVRWRSDTTDPEIWRNVERIPNTELWRTHERRRARLVAYSRRRLREQLTARGASRQELDRVDEVLDPDALTIGFARRFATYKRATLLFRDPERLIRLLNQSERPVQLIFAGKAHPHDEGGKSLIREIVHFARDPRLRDRVVFLEGYDMSVARYLVQGVDVWLNTPRRPLEASGPSGMKVAANGGLNLSILDGWWDEAYGSDVGWAIGHGEEYDDPAHQDEVEASALYDLLEKSVVPLFYDRGRDQLPRQWIAMMKATLGRLAPQYNTDRMVREYCERFYLTARDHYQRLAADGFAPAHRLAEWKVRVLKGWDEVAVESADLAAPAGEPLKAGAEVPVRATVVLGSLTPADVAVELYVGRLDEYRRIRDGRVVAMELESELGPGRFRYRAQLHCTEVGQRGVGVRVIPHSADFATKHDMGLITWG